MNLPKELVFQLKSMALDAAIKSQAAQPIDAAQLIYEWLTKEVREDQASKVAGGILVPKEAKLIV